MPAYRSEFVTTQTYEKISVYVSYLQQAALEPNIFIFPALVQAACGADPALKFKIVLVWHGEELVAAWPLLSKKTNLLSVLTPRYHDYAMLSIPLLHRDHAHNALVEIFALLGKEKEKILHLPFVSSALMQQFAGLADCKIISQQTRGTLLAQQDKEGFFASILSAGNGRSFRKQQHRLERLKVTYKVFVGSEAQAMLPVFLSLEEKSWKGRRGTAISSNKRNRDFIADCVEKMESGDIFISALMQDERPLAMGLILRTGGHVWFWKIAYDQTAAKLSPGVHYAKALAEQMLNDPYFIQADSCAPYQAGRHLLFCPTPRNFKNVLLLLDEKQKWRFYLLIAVLKTNVLLRRSVKSLLIKLRRPGRK